MIKFYCSQCQAKIGVEDRHAGRSLKCPRCGAIARVPRPVPPSPSYPSDNVLAGALELENAVRAQDEIVELEPQQASPPPPVYNPMAMPSRPSPRRSHESFTLAWWAILIFLGGASFMVFTFYQPTRSMELWAISAGCSVFGTLVFSLLVAWLSFLIFGRLTLLASLIFSILVLTAALGVSPFVGRMVDQIQNKVAKREFIAEMAGLRLQQVAGISEKNVDLMKKTVEAGDKAVSRMAGIDRELMVIMTDVWRMQISSEEEAVNSFVKFKNSGMIMTSTLPTHQSLVERIEVLKRYLAARDKTVSNLSNMKQIVRERIAGIKGDEKEKKEFLAAMDARSSEYAMNHKDWETERRFFQSMLDILNLLSSSWGKWKPGPFNRVVFESGDPAGKEYEKHLEELRKIAQSADSKQW